MRVVKHLFFIALLTAGLMGATVARAQMDGGGTFDPEVEKLDDADFEATPAPKPSDPATPANPEATAPARRSNDNMIFDWSQHQNEKEVPHPFAEKGLLRITRDKTYIYRVNESEQKTAAQVRFGFFNPKNLSAKRDDGTDATFEDNYDQTDNPAILVDWEWQLWKSPIGKWGFTTGAGAYVAQGHGHFTGSKNASLEPREVFTFVTVPINVGVVYRLQVWHRQLFVPYGAAGGTIFGFSEFRDDSKPPKWGGALGAYYGGGMAMDLTYFDALSRIALDHEYGVNAVYLTAEYRSFVAITQTFDFSSDFVNAGFLLEY